MNGVCFGEYHNINDLGMFLTSYKIGPATPKIVMIDLPGGDGTIDASDALGRIFYNDRECEFILSQDPADNMTWEQRYAFVCGKINGARSQVVLDSDPQYYYDMRLSVTDVGLNVTTHYLTVTGIAKPWKMKRLERVVTVTGTKTILMRNGRKPAIPFITTSTITSITTEGGQTVGVGFMGQNSINFPDLEIPPGGTTWTITPTGSGANTATTTIKYREGEL